MTPFIGRLLERGVTVDVSSATEEWRRGVVPNLRAFLTTYRTLALVCLVILVNQIGFGLIVPVTPIYARTFGVHEAAVGLVVAVYGLGRFVFSVPVGHAADRFGRRNVIVVGTVLTCIGSVLCGVAGTFV